MAEQGGATEFQDWLTRQVEQRGISLRQVAERSGLSNGTLVQLRLGRNAPEVETVIRLADFFDADPREVLQLAGFGDVLAMLALPSQSDLPAALVELFRQLSHLPPTDQAEVASHIRFKLAQLWRQDPQ